ARLAPAALAAQPFPVDEVRAGELRSGPASPQVLDRLPVEALGAGALGEEGLRAREDAEPPVGAARERPLGEASDGGDRQLALARSRRGLYKGRQCRRDDVQRRLLARLAGSARRGLVAAEAEIEDCRRVAGGRDVQPEIAREG